MISILNEVFDRAQHNDTFPFTLSETSIGKDGHHRVVVFFDLVDARNGRVEMDRTDWIKNFNLFYTI